MDPEQRRTIIHKLLGTAIQAIDPEVLTRSALQEVDNGSNTVIAIGKAAAAMCRGASGALPNVEGICVASTPDIVPEGITLVVGDHPVPGEDSFRAGERVLATVARSRNPILALISGGGSALCEHPIEGVSRDFVSEVNRTVLRSGASIDEMNLVRRHLSAIKGGGLVRVADRPIETLAISDVCGADPSVIASGPTIPHPGDPEGAVAAMVSMGIDVPEEVRKAIMGYPQDLPESGPVNVLADGQRAAAAVVEAARSDGISARSTKWWLNGDLEEVLNRFLDSAGSGLTVAAGEPGLTVMGTGSGGRNTHAALEAALRLSGTDSVFCAFATDGVDGNSGSAGAMVDGLTLARGGDPGEALANFDSGTYLRRTGDLIETGPTGTNVSDLWLLWQ